MKKSYIFYSALGALVAYELFTGSRTGDAVQYVEVIEVAAEASKPLEEVKTASEEFEDTFNAVASLAFGIVWTGILYKIFLGMIKP